MLQLAIFVPIVLAMLCVFYGAHAGQGQCERSIVRLYGRVR